MFTLTAQKCTFTISFRETIYFKKFVGTTIRGALGHELKRMLCIAPAGKRTCDECILSSRCVYAALWEPKHSVAKKAITGRLNYVPHPYVLDVPFYDQPVRFEKGQHFEFSVTLIGGTTKYFPHIILAIENLSEKGIGYGNTAFDIIKVSSMIDHKDFPVYDKGVFKLPEGHLFFDLGKRTEINISALKIHFLTPCRIKGQNRFLREFEWDVFIRRLLYRYTILSVGYCNGDSTLNIEEYLSKSANVKIVHASTEWKEYRRRSGMQNQWMTFSGFRGSVELSGNLTPYWELLKAGEIIHAGKSTTFGMGKYQIKNHVKEAI